MSVRPVAEMIQAIRGTGRVGARTAEELRLLSEGSRGLKMTEWETALASSRSGLQRAGRQTELVEAEAGAAEGKELFSKQVAGKIDAAAAAKEMEAAEKGMWEKTKDFAKVLAVEALKGFAMGLGMEGAMTVWHAVMENLTGSEKDDFKRKMDACDNANKVVSKIMEEWNTWLMTHFGDRDTFGTLKAGSSVTVSKFQVFQASKGALVKIQVDEVVPALGTASRAINSLGLTPLIEKLKKLCTEMLKVSDAIKNDYPEMQAKELKDHKEEIQGVLKALEAA